jgi:pimeloyl-ACP methyl ester carboxylesterase
MSPLRLATDVRLLQAEVVATLREVVLLPWDLGPILPDLAAQTDVVILLHGLLASGGVFRPMRALLEAEGYLTASFSYAPGRRIRSISEQLAKIVDMVPRPVRVHLIGHSLGGIVARDYVQNLGGHERVTQTVSLASPFHGAPHARRFPWFVRDLWPESPVLASIRACPPDVRVPHLSVVAGRDRLIPPDSARLPGAPYVTIPDSGHNTLLFDPDVVRVLVERLNRTTLVAA